jgi:DNA-binding transcriptional regulator of glucitol operon
VNWQFAAILIGALVLGIVLSLWQSRAYMAVVNRMAKAHAGKDLRLVSGRSKGRLRGGVAVLLVNPNTRMIEDAAAMTGSTIFARLHPAPELRGPLDTVAERTQDTHLRKAAESALGMLPAGLRPTARPADPHAGPSRTRIPRPTTSS